MKHIKTFLPLALLGAMLSFSAASSTVQFAKAHKKPSYVVVAKSYFGINLDTTHLETGGANYFVYQIRNKDKGTIIGNINKVSQTWYMNR